MNIIQCQFCKKPFASLRGRVCPACLEQIDKDFIKVRDYIYDHKQTNIDIVAEETEVSKQIILYLLKEGRLIIDSPDGDGGGILQCEMCKKSISTGRLCKDCTGKVASTLDKNVSGGNTPQKSAAVQQNLKGSAKIGSQK
jgi:ribosomal protein L32